MRMEFIKKNILSCFLAFRHSFMLLIKILFNKFYGDEYTKRKIESACMKTSTLADMRKLK